jgi:hypothetical protein
MKLLKLAVPAVLAVSLLGAPAYGETDVKADAQEGGTALDIAEVRHSHSALKDDGTRNLQHKVTMYEEFADETLEEGRIYINLKAGEWTRQIEIRSTNELKATVYDGNKKVGTVRAFRPDNFSVKVAFPTSLLPEGTTSYKWHVVSSTTPACELGPEQEECPAVTDRAPNAGNITSEV